MKVIFLNELSSSLRTTNASLQMKKLRLRGNITHQCHVVKGESQVSWGSLVEALGGCMGPSLIPTEIAVVVG